MVIDAKNLGKVILILSRVEQSAARGLNSFGGDASLNFIALQEAIKDVFAACEELSKLVNREGS